MNTAATLFQQSQLSAILPNPLGHFILSILKQIQHHILIVVVSGANVGAVRDEPLEQSLVRQRSHLKQHWRSKGVLRIEIGTFGMQPRDTFLVVFDSQKMQLGFAESIGQL